MKLSYQNNREHKPKQYVHFSNPIKKIKITKKPTQHLHKPIYKKKILNQETKYSPGSHS